MIFFNLMHTIFKTNFNNNDILSAKLIYLVITLLRNALLGWINDKISDLTFNYDQRCYN